MWASRATVSAAPSTADCRKDKSGRSGDSWRRASRHLTHALHQVLGQMHVIVAEEAVAPVVDRVVDTSLFAHDFSSEYFPFRIFGCISHGFARID